MLFYIWFIRISKHDQLSKFQDPVYQRTRELLVLKEQLDKSSEECRKELKARLPRNVSTPNRIPLQIHM